jgi:hypothetical protein
VAVLVRLTTLLQRSTGITMTTHGNLSVADPTDEVLTRYFPCRRRVSSASIVSGYGLDDRAIGVRSPAGTKDFSSSLCVQTGSGAHPASCTMGTGGPFPGAKRGRGATLTTHPHLVPRSGMSRSYTSSPPSASMACSGTALLYFPYKK